MHALTLGLNTTYRHFCDLSKVNTAETNLSRFRCSVIHESHCSRVQVAAVDELKNELNDPQTCVGMFSNVAGFDTTSGTVLEIHQRIEELPQGPCLR